LAPVGPLGGITRPHHGAYTPGMSTVRREYPKIVDVDITDQWITATFADVRHSRTASRSAILLIVEAEGLQAALRLAPATHQPASCFRRIDYLGLYRVHNVG